MQTDRNIGRTWSYESPNVTTRETSNRSTPDVANVKVS